MENTQILPFYSSGAQTWPTPPRGWILALMTLKTDPETRLEQACLRAWTSPLPSLRAGRAHFSHSPSQAPTPFLLAQTSLAYPPGSLPAPVSVLVPHPIPSSSHLPDLGFARILQTLGTPFHSLPLTLASPRTPYPYRITDSEED